MGRPKLTEAQILAVLRAEVAGANNLAVVERMATRALRGAQRLSQFKIRGLPVRSAKSWARHSAGQASPS